jgi:arsenate reductase-like glutaredoxin family protein
MTCAGVVVWDNPRCSKCRGAEELLATATAGELVEAMSQYPELIERPVVIWPGRAVITEPPELLIPLLCQS